MSLPCNLNDEAHAEASSKVGTAIAINYIKLLVRKLLHCEFLQSFPSLLSYRLVVVLVFVACPPHSVLRCSVHNDEFVLRRATGVDTCHHVYSTKLSYLAFLITGEFRICLIDEELLIRRVVNDLRSSLNAILS